jgi:predicted O-linked N-acetylglucosamine transferase (SPINDLY family)
VVTLQGDRHASRVSASLLSAVGFPELIATTTDDYIRIAVELARDRARVKMLRAGLRREMQASPLLDHAGQSARFGAALRASWTEWCRAHASSPVHHVVAESALASRSA